MLTHATQYKQQKSFFKQCNAMKSHLLLCCLVCYMQGRIEGAAPLLRTLHALTRGVHFFNSQVDNINLDAVFAARQIQELLQTYLTYQTDEFLMVQHWIEVLRDKAKRIADQGMKSVIEKDPAYAAVVGFLMEESLASPWYPSRPTDPSSEETRVTCSGSRPFNETASDLCFSELGKSDCNISPICKNMNSIHHQRDYTLTHQMLFWRIMELRDCVDTIPSELQQRMCSNVMRDAKYIAGAEYPESHKDLLMEQIGICGFWGFRDFHKLEWLEKVLDWQQPSGCYSGFRHYSCSDNLQPDPPNRTKRREKVLTDNCWVHRTSVALLALVVNLRFEAEKNYKEMEKSQNTLNKLLR